MRLPKIPGALGLLAGLLTMTAAPAAEPPAVPDDFKIVARYAPGFSNWLAWQYAITADGKVVQDIGPGGRGGGERSRKETTLSKDDVAALYARVKEADFFTLKERYRGSATDQPTLVLEVTANGKTHKVQVYGHRFLREKEEQDAGDRFLGVWSTVLLKRPAPNPDQKPDLYKPGNYAPK
jgi:hypothetical protein